jgi:hypothetical protein
VEILHITGEGPMYRQPQKEETTPKAQESTGQAKVEMVQVDPRGKAMLELFNSLPETEQNEVLQLAQKEKDLADMRERLEKLERKTA